MSSLCAYRLCTSKFERGSSKLSYHRFPMNNEHLLQKWLLAMNQPGFTPTGRHMLCSAHIEEAAFLAGLQCRRLHEGAVPSRFYTPHNDKKAHDTPSPATEEASRSCHIRSDGGTSTTALENVLLDHTYSSAEQPEGRMKRFREDLNAARKKVNLLQKKQIAIARLMKPWEVWQGNNMSTAHIYKN
nr:THAP domain-containing protein 3-like [Dermacentor andersoni]